MIDGARRRPRQRRRACSHVPFPSCARPRAFSCSLPWADSGTEARSPLSLLSLLLPSSSASPCAALVATHARAMSDSQQSTQSTLIFSFLVTFLGIFAVGVSGGIVWPAIRRLLARTFGWPLEEVRPAGVGGGEAELPRLWDVVLKDAEAEGTEDGGKGKGSEKASRSSGSASLNWERLRASTSLPSCSLRARKITSCACAAVGLPTRTRSFRLRAP